MDVLHVDEHLLVVNKPAGLLAQPDHTGDDHVLRYGKDVLAARGAEDDPFLGLVHRLDRPTSGIMVLARTSAAARKLSKQFRQRTVSKEYLAVVEGRLSGIGTWTDYVAKPGRRPQLVGPDHPEGKHARLQWQARAHGNAQTLLHLQLQTGRPHQIRLQASARGHPVVGDVRYGAGRSLNARAILLHHAILRVEHPSQSRRMTVVASPPAEWDEGLVDAVTAPVTRILRRARPPQPSEDESEANPPDGA